MKLFPCGWYRLSFLPRKVLIRSKQNFRQESNVKTWLWSEGLIWSEPQVGLALKVKLAGSGCVGERLLHRFYCNQEGTERRSKTIHTACWTFKSSFTDPSVCVCVCAYECVCEYVWVCLRVCGCACVCAWGFCASVCAFVLLRVCMHAFRVCKYAGECVSACVRACMYPWARVYHSTLYPKTDSNEGPLAFSL